MLVKDCHCSAMVSSNACTVRIKADLAPGFKERVDRGLKRLTGSISCLAATPPAATVQSPLARLERLWSCPGWKARRRSVSGPTLAATPGDEIAAEICS